MTVLRDFHLLLNALTSKVVIALASLAGEPDIKLCCQRR